MLILLSCRWAIRNCGLMLLKALLTRLNGGTDVSSARAASSRRRFSRLTYEKFPNLPGLILRLLCNQAKNSSENSVWHAQKVFPALEIVERCGLPLVLEAEIKQAICFHLEGPVWPIREKAAKALSLVLSKRNLLNEASRLLSSDWRSHNALHGRLLCLRSLVGQMESPLTGDQLGTYSTVQADSFVDLQV